jgi:ABC-type branched-subunit amino acid transport system substrate-binding protein
LRRGGAGSSSIGWILGGLAVAGIWALVIAVVVTGGGSGGPAGLAGAGGAPGAGGSSAGTGSGADAVDPLAPPASPRPKPAGGPSIAPADATGVTAATIRLGIQLPDTGLLRAIGAQPPSVDVRGLWQAFIDDVNDRGGINGRRLEPVYRVTNPIDTVAMRADCLAWTRDAKVFAVLATIGYYGPPVRCITEENRTPFLTLDGQPESWQDGSSRGLLFSVPTNKSRVLRNFADWLGRTNLLRGHTVGLLDNGGFDHETVTSALLPQLAQRGIRVASQFTFSTDTVAQQRQFPLAVAQLRRAGVDTVIVTTGYLATVGTVTAARSSGFAPTWFFSPYAGGTSDLIAGGLPADTDAIGLAGSRAGERRAGLPVAPADDACIRTYERASGSTIDRSDDATVQSVVGICAEVQLFERGARGAGPRLDRRTFSAGVARIGAIDLPGYGASSFGPGKYDGADTARVVDFTGSCRCWTPYPGSRLEDLPLP